MSNTQSKKTIVGASLIALVVAALLLFVAVLPAEYGFDPLGSGAALGLTELSDSNISPLNAQSEQWYQDHYVVQLAPYESVEYKYRLAAGKTLLFNWEATSELVFDLHAEPDGAAPGYADTFDKSRGTQRSGNYVAPYDGIHGWFWQNRTRQDITLTLSSSGYYSESIEMRDGKEFHYDAQRSKQDASSRNNAELQP